MDIDKVKELKKQTEIEIDGLLSNLSKKIKMPVELVIDTRIAGVIGSPIQEYYYNTTIKIVL